MAVRLEGGNCLEVMQRLQRERVRVDAIVTDPPYHLTAEQKGRARRGFMGKSWDGGDVAFNTVTWGTAAGLLKPGGWLLAFSGTRTYHRMGWAIEGGGFEVRDMISWLYGSGFPKSHDVSKAIDRRRDDYEAVCRVASWLRPHVKRIGFAAVTAHFGFKDETMARARWTTASQPQVPSWEQWQKLQALCGFSNEMDAEVWRLNGRKGQPGEAWSEREFYDEPTGGLHGGSGDTVGAFNKGRQAKPGGVTTEAQEWQGWGTALKPACEPICVARKPLSEGSVAANVLKHGTGALNVDGCRVGMEQTVTRRNGDSGGLSAFGRDEQAGRWPANVCHDGSPEVEAAFAAFDDGGSPLRFWYDSKADAYDRWGSKHPTVKPIDLMRWLVRLVTPPGGTVLDPFAGSGTTGIAAMAEGFDCILIEREEEYLADIRERLAFYEGDGKHSLAAKNKKREQAPDDLPLFGKLEQRD